jgi:hypothetical protein
MAKRIRKGRRDRKQVSTTARAQRRENRTVERLHEAIEVERENLSKAESVLGCLAIAMEYELEGAGRPYYPDVANIAREMVRRSVSSLDPLTLRRVRDKIEEEAYRTYPHSTKCRLTFDHRLPGLLSAFSTDAQRAPSASANI